MARSNHDVNRKGAFDSIEDAEVIAIMTVSWKFNRFVTEEDIKSAHKWLKSVGAKRILINSAIKVNRLISSMIKQ